jgi:GNAT superfamily N-acetyltransferase
VEKEVRKIQFDEEPDPRDIGKLDDRIYEFNVAATGIADGRYLASFLKDETGEIYAGISGHTWGETCEIKLLWIAEPHRGQGLGSLLLSEAEREAARRGCKQIMLSTHSFQAPAFYAARGYREFGRVPNYPKGHASIYLMKSLSSA